MDENFTIREITVMSENVIRPTFVILIDHRYLQVPPDFCPNFSRIADSFQQCVSGFERPGVFLGCLTDRLVVLKMRLL